jgi:tetratricopeptide (TPR) repeat protein
MLDRQPENPISNNLIGWIHWQKLFLGISKDAKKDLQLARQHGVLGAKFGGQGHSHILLSAIDLLSGRHKDAVANVERAIELTPGEADILMIGGSTLINSGEWARGIDLMRRGIRLEPDHPSWVIEALATGLAQIGQLTEARDLARVGLASSSTNVQLKPRSRRMLTALSVWLDDLPGAKTYMKQLLELQPNLTYQIATGWFPSNQDREFVKKFADPLDEAGLPNPAK